MDLFLVVWLTCALTIWPVWFWVSFSSRRKRGEPIIPRPPANARFCERGASGGKDGSPFGQASKCLMVCVSEGVLWVTPTFPFNMIAPYGLLGLEHRVALRDVRDVELKPGLLGRTVRLRIERAGAAPAILNLQLKAPEDFLAAIRG